MGDVLGIVEQLNDHEYRIQYLITGIEQIVSIDPDKQSLFREHSIYAHRPLVCPFLRERGEGIAVCTVYQTRPEICQIYACSKS